MADAAVGTVGMTGGTIIFQAGPRTANVVTMQKSYSAVAYYFVLVADTGPGATIETGTGCSVEQGSVLCANPAIRPSGGIRGFRVVLGDGNDSFLLDARPPATVDVPARVSGGTGNDRITTADGADVIVGGPGINTVRGGGGNDRLEMRNGARDALIDCGAGIDTAVVDLKDPGRSPAKRSCVPVADSRIPALASITP